MCPCIVRHTRDSHFRVCAMFSYHNQLLIKRELVWILFICWQQYNVFNRISTRKQRRLISACTAVVKRDEVNDGVMVNFFVPFRLPASWGTHKDMSHTRYPAELVTVCLRGEVGGGGGLRSTRIHGVDNAYDVFNWQDIRMANVYTKKNWNCTTSRYAMRVSVVCAQAPVIDGQSTPTLWTSWQS